ncbi:hypothetical protein NHX12_019570 [Muraenolepis orangiensis]|uniref:Uncharacterized protein n=1 Tax=Muraenolepis orangiensis TaxID=630683 RepID=A0A9Q0ETT2_9TELE|nr:hypothetical protein NHX12_019570 [Muraenolepis orangiensis]
MAVWMTFHSLWLMVLLAVLIQTVTVVISWVYLNNVLNTMRQSISHSSMSCVMDVDLRSAPPGLQDSDDTAEKSDPCWQLRQQLHHRIDKTMTERLQKDMFTLKKSKSRM